MSDSIPSVLHAPTLALRRLASLSLRAGMASGSRPLPALYGSGGINVLVYSGPGTAKFAVENTVATLKAVLRDQYDVMKVDAKALLTEPWQDSTALVVIPGGRDLPYVKELSPKGTSLIKDYVHRGGRYLGICAGAYFGCDRIEFEKGRPLYEVTGDRDLKFFDGLAIGSAYPGFVYDEETGARAIEMSAHSALESSSEILLPAVDATPHTIKTYHNGGCAFVEDPSAAVPMTVLARYSQPIALYSGQKLEDPNPPAVVLTRPGLGYALLSGVHMEYDAALMAAQKGGKEAKLSKLAPELEKTEKERVAFFTACLKAMGLRVAGSERNAVESESGLSPLPTSLHVTFADQEAASFVPGLLNKCSEDATTVSGKSIAVFDDTAFQLRLLHDPSLLADRPQLDGLISELESIDLDAQREALIVTGDAESTPPKPAINMLIHKPRSYPPPSETPHFDIPLFHKLSSQLSSSSSSSAPSFASILAYSHVIPSTQTLIDKNFRFSQLLPDGFTAVATHQTAGRGRGRNSWISPLGCLQFSLLLRHPRDAPPVVFIQYLFALAVVEAVRSKEGCEELPVFIKWPNDVYAKVKGKDGEVELKKLGGILINSSFVDGKFVLVIGHGLNVSNATPSTCLNSLLSAHAPHLPPFAQEETLALILHRFRILYYDHYLTGGFPAVEGRYKRYWIHQDQIVGVEGVEGKLKIKGINEGGELVVVKIDGDGKEKSGKDNTLALTPDGNGFDMLRGLLVSKHAR